MFQSLPSSPPTCSRLPRLQTQKHTLKFEKVGALFVHVWPFRLQDFIQTLAL